ncbi:MAG: SRPBCC family protein [Bacillota bacterium]
MLTLTRVPIVRQQMVIRRPPHEVFEAFVDPQITTKFWFSKSSGRLEAGKTVRWDWEKYGVGDNVYVREIEQDRRILIEWSSDHTQTEWLFEPLNDGRTLVTIANSGFAGTGDDVVSYAIDSMGGYTFLLSGLKALLEHNVILDLVADKTP